jgi:hypothetical protein
MRKGKIDLFAKLVDNSSMYENDYELSAPIYSVSWGIF